MDWYKRAACNEIDAQADNMLQLANTLWDTANKSPDKSIEAITEVLKKHEFEITYDLNGMPGTFKAESGKNSTPTQKRLNVAFVCRYSKEHMKSQFKGNPLVSEIAVAAAIGVKTALELSSPIFGKVTVIGCPDTFKGELATLVNIRVFRNIDVVMLGLPANRTDWNPQFAGRKTFRATYRSNHLEAGTSDCDEKAAALMAYQNALMLQDHFLQDWKMKATFGKTGMKNECRATVCTSAPTYKELFYMEKRVTACLDAAAKASGCEYEMDMAQKSYFPFVNNTQLSYLIQTNAYYTGTLSTPLHNYVEVHEPVDVCNVSHMVPTLMPFFFSGTEADMDSEEFEAELRELPAQMHTIAIAKALAMTAIDVLNVQSGAICKIKEDLVQSLASEKTAKFKPFAIRTNPVPQLKMELPFEGNTGWSKQP